MNLIKSSRILGREESLSCGPQNMVPIQPPKLLSGKRTKRFNTANTKAFQFHLIPLSCIVARLCAGQPGFNSQPRQGLFLFATPSRLALGPTTSYLVGTRGSFPRGKVVQA